MLDMIKNLKGILSSPGPTLGQLMGEKKWMANLILILALVFIFTYISTPGLLHKSQILDYFNPEQVESLSHISGFRLIMASLWAMIITLITMMIAGFFTYLFYGIARAEGTYANYFSVVANASVIGTAIPLVLGILSFFTRIPFMNFSTPAALFRLPPDSLAFLILSRLDLFYMWYLIAIAAGVSVFSKLKFKKCLWVAFLYFLFVSAIKISFSAIFLRLLRN